MKEEFYFRSIDENICIPLEEHLYDAKLEGLEEITLVEAIPYTNNPDYIWCTHFGDVEERHTCKKSHCGAYSSKSGRGVCSHRGRLYEYGEEKTFKISHPKQ